MIVCNVFVTFCFSGKGSWSRKKGIENFQTAEPIGENLSRAGKVKANKSIATLAEYIARTDHDTSAVEKNLRDFGGGEPGGPTINPCKIGGLEGRDGKCRHVLFHPVGEETEISVEIISELSEPIAPVAVGRY